MWIPVITILWSLGATSAWINFPMINFPLSTSEKCYQYIDQVRTQTMLNPDYLKDEWQPSRYLHIYNPDAQVGIPNV